jgi:Protein of unknown function, DUF488
MSTRAHTAFSWGYWGWGTHTEELVSTIDAIERKHGRRAPVFVDIRISRQVRAPGFRADTFEKLLGKRRYVWLPRLGNANVKAKRRGIKIADPSAAGDLLDLVIRVGEEKRRVIFFCSCERPAGCHRAVAGKLLLKRARARGVSLMVVEWPGGEPTIVSVPVTGKTLRSILNGGNRVPLDLAPKSLRTRLRSLPWASRVSLRSADASLGIVAGPAQLGTDWYLPVIGPETSAETDSVRSLASVARRLRTSLGYDPRN